MGLWTLTLPAQSENTESVVTISSTIISKHMVDGVKIDYHSQLPFIEGELNSIPTVTQPVMNGYSLFGPGKSR